MNSIERYVNNIVSGLNYSKDEVEEFKLQFIDHINLLKEEYLSKGYSEEKSTKYAIKDFGNSDLIRNEINNNPTNRSEIFRSIIGLTFAFYGIFLILVLLNPFKSGEFVQTARNNGGWFGLTVNIIPFKTIVYYFTAGNSINSDIIVRNLLGKILLFIPWGFLLPLIFQKAKKLKVTILITLITTLIIQLIRIIFPIGIADIDNVILYVLGSSLGFLLNKYVIRFLSGTKLLYKLT